MSKFKFNDINEKIDNSKIIDPGKQIGYNFAYWGPLLWWSKVTNDFKEQLLERGYQTTIDNRQNLAGHLEKENLYNRVDQEWFAKNFYPYLSAYAETFDLNWKNNANISRKNPKKVTQYSKRYFNLQSLWINFMRPGDFNPPHFHSGDLSFVIFLKVPKELKEENKNFIGKSSGPGSIYFQFGEHQEHMITNHKFFPEENQVIIFPATLNHSVFPFKSDCERISVSGNFEIEYE